MCALDSVLVATGGMDEKHNFNSDIFLWKKGADKWVPNSKPISTKVTFPELVPVADGKVLVVGGHGPKMPAGLWEVIDIDSI
jgi:hypothetical protein